MRRGGVISFIMIMFCSMMAAAQNLVSNSSLDTFTIAPNDYAQMCRATGYSSATGNCVLVVGSGSPDYYNTAGSGGAKPPATWWATVSPHSGSGMGGFAPWYATSSNYREYIRTTLTSPMVVGTMYEVSFWLTNAVSSIHGYGCNHIGAAFTSTQLTQSFGTPITSVTPQCELTTVFWSTTWQKVIFYFTPTSAYQYMCIGNFHNDAGTTATMYASGNSGCYLYLDDIVVKPATILPIELISFTADLNENNTVSLEWKTASEKNNALFSVERSDDAAHFTEIGTVAGAGTSAEPHSYSLIDESPGHGVNYYRVVQIDDDGTKTYSSIVEVDVDFLQTEIQMLVSPNPAKNIVVITFLLPNDFKSSIEVSIGATSGAVVYQRKISPEDLINHQYFCYVEELPSGLYFLKAFSEGKYISSSKLIVE